MLRCLPVPARLGLILLLNLAVPGLAQSSPDPHVLINEILATHPAVRQAQHKVAAAEATLEGSGLQPNPTLNLAATVGDAGENSNALVQTFEISGQPRLRREQAQANLESARLQLRLARRAVAGDVLGSWLELWEKEHLADLALLRLRLMNDMAHASRRRYEVGEIPQNEALRVELVAAQAEADWRTAEAAHASALRSLDVLRGLVPLTGPLAPAPSSSGPLTPATPLVSTAELSRLLQGPALAPEGQPWTLEQALASAEENPEVQALRQEQRATLLSADLLAKERAPQLGVQVYRSRFFGSDIEQGAQVFISWPIFDWGNISARQRAQREQAAAQLAAADERVLGLRREVADVWSRWQAAQTVRGILLSQAERYEELAREARIGYDLGLLTLTDVLQTESSFREAGVQVIKAQAEVYRLELEMLERTNLPWPTTLLEEQ